MNWNIYGLTFPVQCVFYIALRSFASLPVKTIARSYDATYRDVLYVQKVLLICSFVLYFGKLIRGAVCACNMRKKEEEKSTFTHAEKTNVDFICMSCSSARTSFTQLTTAIPIHVSLLWVVNRLCWAAAAAAAVSVAVAAAYFPCNVHTFAKLLAINFELPARLSYIT